MIHSPYIGKIHYYVQKNNTIIEIERFYDYLIMRGETDIDKRLNEFSDHLALDENFNNLYLSSINEYNYFMNNCTINYLDQTYWISRSGHDFEMEILNLFISKGYKGIKTKGSNDKGIDLVIEGTLGIQCKNHKTKISPNNLRDFYGACISESLNNKLFISTNGFSKESIKFAISNNLIMWSVEDIIAFVKDKIQFPFLSQ